MESNHQPADYKSAALPIEPRQRDSPERECGASGENRTLDTRIFSPLLYRLSYRGKKKYTSPANGGTSRTRTLDHPVMSRTL